MNQKRLKILACGAMLLSAVATTGCSTLSTPWFGNQQVDQQKIDIVNAWAQSHNVTVIWVNEPMRSQPVQAPTSPKS